MIEENKNNEVYNAGIEVRRKGLGLFISLYMMQISVPSWDEQDTEDFKRGYNDANKGFNPIAN